MTTLSTTTSTTTTAVDMVTTMANAVVNALTNDTTTMLVNATLDAMLNTTMNPGLEPFMNTTMTNDQDFNADNSSFTPWPLDDFNTTLNGTTGSTTEDPEVVKERDMQDFFIGLGLAVISALFTGSSFIFKKLGLLRYAKKVSVRAGGGGLGYLKEWMWWAGMFLMTFGELTNFAAFAFAPATLVTPLGALSIIVAAILSARVLKERLNILGKLGCVLCILGSTIMVIHSPKESEIHYVDELAEKLKEPAFIVYASCTVILAIVMIFYFSPRYGQTNVLVYVSICSSLGSFTVMGCKGLGTAITATARGHNEFTNWVTYLLLAVVIVCIVIQLNYLNKALDTFNTAVVTPIYYVVFTSFVIIGSAVLFKEFFNMAVLDIVGDACGFLTIVTGIFLLNAFRDMKVSWRNIPKATKDEKTEGEGETGNGHVGMEGITNTTYVVDCSQIEAHISRSMSNMSTTECITQANEPEGDVETVKNGHVQLNDRYHGSSPVQEI